MGQKCLRLRSGAAWLLTGDIFASLEGQSLEEEQEDRKLSVLPLPFTPDLIRSQALRPLGLGFLNCGNKWRRESLEGTVKFRG